MIARTVKIINKMRKGRDAKALIQNFGYLSLLQVAGYIFPLLTIPYLARVIGVDKFGEIAFAAAVILWFKTVAEWGFNYTATRDVARLRDDKEAVSRTLSNVLWSQSLLALVGLAILLLATEVIPIFKQHQAVLLVSFLMVPASVLFPVWFFQALEKMKYITIFSLLSKIVFTLSIFVFIKEKDDFILQPLFSALGFMLSGAAAFYLILKRWGYRLYPPKVKSIAVTISGSKDVFLNNIIPNLYNSFSVVLLGFYSGGVANGKLDAATRLVAVAQQFMLILSRVFFPFLSRKIDKHRLYASLNLTLAFCASLVLFFFSSALIKLFYTPEFYDAIIVLKIMAFSIFFLSLSNVYGVNYMIIKGREKELRNITFFCSLLGFLLAWPLIYYFSFVGAAITITGTRALLGVSIMLKARTI